MSDTLQEDTTFTACVHPSFIARVDRLFDNSIMTILDELVQNSRRAGASNIVIDIHKEATDEKALRIIIEDDGVGLEDPRKLLSLSESCWKGMVVEEDPAGMGFFSLCRSHARVWSHDWAISLEPEMFLGQKPIVIEKLVGGFKQGMVVIFTYSNHACFDLDYTLRRLKTSLPLVPASIVLNGESLKRKDYLEDAKLREVWRGVEIGIADSRTAGTYYGNVRDVQLNFYGKELSENLSEHLVRGFIATDTKPKMVTYAGEDIKTATLGISHSRSSMRAIPLLNVLDASFLKLQHPDRRSVIQTDEWEETKLKINEMTMRAYENVLKAEDDAIPVFSFEQSDTLRNLHGRTIAAGSFLEKFQCDIQVGDYSTQYPDLDWPYGITTPRKVQLPTHIDVTSPTKSKVLVVPATLHEDGEKTVKATLAMADLCSGEAAGVLLVNAKGAYVGYPWYDDIAVLERIDLILDGTRVEGYWQDGLMSSECEAFVEDMPGKIDTAELVLVTNKGEEIHLPTAGVLAGDDPYNGEEVDTVIVSRAFVESGFLTTKCLADWLYVCIYEPYDDDSSGESEERYSDAADAAKLFAISILQDSSAAFKAEIQDIVQGVVGELCFREDPSGKTELERLTIIFDKNREPKIECVYREVVSEII